MFPSATKPFIDQPVARFLLRCNISNAAHQKNLTVIAWDGYPNWPNSMEGLEDLVRIDAPALDAREVLGQFNRDFTETFPDHGRRARHTERRRRRRAARGRPVRGRAGKRRRARDSFQIHLFARSSRRLGHWRCSARGTSRNSTRFSSTRARPEFVACEIRVVPRPRRRAANGAPTSHSNRVPTTVSLICGRLAAPDGRTRLIVVAPAAAKPIRRGPAPAAAADALESAEPLSRGPPLDGPIRFLWTLDADGRFGETDAALPARVGPNAPRPGESLESLRRRLSFDAWEGLAAAIAARRTFSGLRLEWPEPSFARKRIVLMSGFRGSTASEYFWVFAVSGCLPAREFCR